MSRMFRQNGWTKWFKNGTTLNGLDKNIPSGLCSWRNSELSGMIGCSLNHDLLSLRIVGDGEYWQSDTLAAVMTPDTTVKPTWRQRRIEKKLGSSDRVITVKPRPNCLTVEVSTAKSNTFHLIDTTHSVTEAERGQWLIVEVDIPSSQFRWYLSKEKI